MSSCIHHLHHIICAVSCKLFRMNAVISRTWLDIPHFSPPSTSALRPSVSCRGVHRWVPHGLQAVHHSAEPGLASPSSRYWHTHTHTLILTFIYFIFYFGPTTLTSSHQYINVKFGGNSWCVRISTGVGFISVRQRRSLACAEGLSRSQTRGKVIFKGCAKAHK